MATYWFLFLLPSLAFVYSFKCTQRLRDLGLGVFWAVAVVLIGLRFEVGGDWNSYLYFLEVEAAKFSFAEAMLRQDPGYAVINWLSHRAGLGVFGVNLVCGLALMTGLTLFCRRQPFTHIGLALSVPYIIIVVGMGYSRQAAALGFVFLAFAYWDKSSFTRYVATIMIGALFHKTAVVMLPIGLLINNKNIGLKLLLVTPILALASFYLVATSNLEGQIRAYIEHKNYDSSGALVRVLMNAAPAFVYILLRKKFARFPDHKLWMSISICSLLALTTVSQFSTATDRLSLYFMPIQIAVFCRLPLLFADRFIRTTIILLLLIVYATVLFVWLNHASHAELWLPYKTVIIG